MLAEIEAAVLAKLNANGIRAKIFNARADRTPRKQFFQPTVFCSIDAADFERLTQTTFTQTVSIFLILTFKNTESEADRRDGIYPILEGVISLLTLQTLDIDGLKPLQPVNFKNITDNLDALRGEILFQLEFSTKYAVSKAADEAAETLLKIGTEYFIHPEDDGEADGEAIAELS